MQWLDLAHVDGLSYSRISCDSLSFVKTSHWNRRYSKMKKAMRILGAIGAGGKSVHCTPPPHIMILTTYQLARVENVIDKWPAFVSPSILIICYFYPFFCQHRNGYIARNRSIFRMNVTDGKQNEMKSISTQRIVQCWRPFIVPSTARCARQQMCPIPPFDTRIGLTLLISRGRDHFYLSVLVAHMWAAHMKYILFQFLFCLGAKREHTHRAICVVQFRSRSRLQNKANQTCQRHVCRAR